jgi:hypothetical protein
MLGDGHFGVGVTIDGRAPQTFAVDTGAEMTYVPATLVAALGLQPAGTFSFQSFSGKGFEVPMYAMPPLRVGETALPAALAQDWSGLDRFAVPPLLSLWSFTNGPVTIDLPGKTLTFEDDASFAARTRAALRVPLALSRDRDRSLLAFVDVDFGNGQKGQCLIDTGSGGTMIDARYMPALGLKPSGDPHVVATLSDQPEGRRTHYAATIPSVSLAAAPALRLTNPEVDFVDHPIYDCELGNDFWADKIFTLDLAHAQMFVSPAPQA